MDLIGKYPIVGTEKTVTALTQPITEINALAEGTYYQFQVKVVTLKGSSNFSPITTAKTTFQQTQLDKLKENINIGLIKPGIAKLQKEMQQIVVSGSVERTILAANVSNLMNKLMGHTNFATRMRTDLWNRMMENKNFATRMRTDIRKSITAVNKKVEDHLKRTSKIFNSLLYNQVLFTTIEAEYFLY